MQILELVLSISRLAPKASAPKNSPEKAPGDPILSLQPLSGQVFPDAQLPSRSPLLCDRKNSLSSLS